MATHSTWTFAAIIVGCSCGCLGRGSTDLLQVRLREQQQLLAETRAELDSTSRELKLARKEADGLRTQLAGKGPALLPEHSSLLVRASGIRINPMLTAGFDRDDAFGDDMLVLQFTPLDEQGEVLKLPGDIRIRVLDPALAEESQTVAEWKFTAAQGREHWVRGLLGSGYQFSLPWQEPPRNKELIIHVQLRTADGREFTATHVLKITPPVVTADSSRIIPAAAAAAEPSAAETRKPEVTRPVYDDSTNWTRDEFPVLR